MGDDLGADLEMARQGLATRRSATFVLGAAGAPTSVWQLVPGFGRSSLWVTGAMLLATNLGRAT